MDNQPANVRLFVMHGGVETFVDLVASAFQHAHSLSASSSNSSTAVAVVPPLAITNGDGDEASPSGSSGSEEHFGSAAGARVPRRERASDMSVALTCRELVVECISCLSSALEVGCCCCFSWVGLGVFGLNEFIQLSVACPKAM